MSNFSDSPHPNEASVEESIQSTLQAGLSALKQKKYQAAIVQLETVYQAATHVPTLLKAQMGLVKAYAAIGNPDRAVMLCQSLRDQSNPQVNAWARQTLAELEQRSATSPIPPGSDATGFAPLPPKSSPSSATTKRQTAKRQTVKQPDKTGFVPLSAPPATAREPIAPQSPQPEFDRELQELEETEILPLDAEVDWQTAIETPKPGKPPVAPKPAVSCRSATADPSTPRAAPLPQHTLPNPALPNHTLTWRQAGRAQKWTSLGKTDVSPLWALQLLTVLVLGWVICTLIQVGQILLNGLIFFFSWMPFLRSVWISGDPTWLVGWGLIALFSASPWLLHGLLQRMYQLQRLSLSELEQYSPESVRLLKRVSHQQHCPVPMLGVLPLAAPIAFSYGYLPRLARIVVSQGLLEQLSDDEIAAIYAAELGHIKHWDFGILSGLILVAQLPYCVYWTVAAWGNQQTDRVLQSLAVLVSSIGYGIYWCCRLAGLWLSHVRLYYSDRAATDLTGNPNGLTRALLKLTIGIAAEIQHQGYTDPLLESFDLLIPVNPRAALTLGSLYPHTPTSALMTWDRSHRFRRWFACQTSHPLLGDRLSVLSSYAQRWRLEAELDWGEKAEGRGQRTTQNSKSKIQNPNLRRFLLQNSPLVGILVGLAIGLLLRQLGWVGYQARFSFDWLWYERESIARGCLLLGFGIGLLIQINPAFRDMARSNRQTESALADLLSDPGLMPIDSTPVYFQGKLLGRHNFHNRCHQDLLLQTSTGLVRLHYSSRGGFLGNVFSQSQRPIDLIKPNETVSVTGWFRRSAIPWIDVETIQTRRSIVRSGYPIWLTIVAFVSTAWGVYTIF